MRLIKKYKHSIYNLDSTFECSGLERRDVSQLTEMEAKDLACNLMDCIEQFTRCGQRQYEKMQQIALKYNFNL